MDSGQQEQRQVFTCILATAIIISAITYFFGLKDFTRGLVFGVLLTLANYWVVGLIIGFAFRRASNNVAKLISFVGYQIRFLIIVLILFLVIPKSPYWFSVGTFVGVLLPKMVMGVHLLRTKDEEWWNNPSADLENTAPCHSVNTVQDVGVEAPQNSGHDDSKENPNFTA